MPEADKFDGLLEEATNAIAALRERTAKMEQWRVDGMWKRIDWLKKKLSAADEEPPPSASSS